MLLSYGYLDLRRRGEGDRLRLAGDLRGQSVKPVQSTDWKSAVYKTSGGH